MADRMWITDPAGGVGREGRKEGLVNSVEWGARGRYGLSRRAIDGEDGIGWMYDGPGREVRAERSDIYS